MIESFNFYVIIIIIIYNSEKFRLTWSHFYTNNFHRSSSNERKLSEIPDRVCCWELFFFAKLRRVALHITPVVDIRDPPSCFCYRNLQFRVCDAFTPPKLRIFSIQHLSKPIFFSFFQFEDKRNRRQWYL